MQVDEKLVRYLEELSYIELSDTDRESMIGGIQVIFDRISVLKGLDTEGVSELPNPLENVNVFRDDIVIKSMDRALLLKNAHQKTDEMFIAPKTVE